MSNFLPWKEQPEYVEAVAGQPGVEGLSKYAHPDGPISVGGDPVHDFTTFIPAQASWTIENPPRVLRMIQAPPRWVECWEDLSVPMLEGESGQIVMERWPESGQEPKGMRRFDILPHQIWSGVKGWLIEAWMRLDPAIQLFDIRMRIYGPSRPKLVNLIRRRNRYRTNYEALLWQPNTDARVPSENSLTRNERIMATISKDQINANIRPSHVPLVAGVPGTQMTPLLWADTNTIQGVRSTEAVSLPMAGIDASEPISNRHSARAAGPDDFDGAMQEKQCSETMSSRQPVMPAAAFDISSALQVAARPRDGSRSSMQEGGYQAYTQHYSPYAASSCGNNDRTDIFDLNFQSADPESAGSILYGPSNITQSSHPAFATRSSGFSRGFQDGSPHQAYYGTSDRAAAPPQVYGNLATQHGMQSSTNTNNLVISNIDYGPSSRYTQPTTQTAAPAPNDEQTTSQSSMSSYTDSAYIDSFDQSFGTSDDSYGGTNISSFGSLGDLNHGNGPDLGGLIQYPLGNDDYDLDDTVGSLT